MDTHYLAAKQTMGVQDKIKQKGKPEQREEFFSLFSAKANQFLVSSSSYTSKLR
jgi:hypothetical protein